MGASNGNVCEEVGRGIVTDRPQALCPVCNGPLIPLRGNYRCARCFFSLCVGCEGPDVPTLLDLAD
jgi:hypothetical protein